MKIRCIALFAILALAVLPSAPAATQSQNWIEGVHYVLVEAIPRTAPPPGKIVVTEVFSYACPACNEFNPIVRKLIATLPSNVVFNYVPAGFRPDEDWPVFQRAYCTAESLGIAAKTHDAMFDAVWRTGELATVDAAAHRLKSPMPTIEDTAKFYARQAGIKAEDFVTAAKSFDADRRIREANQYIRDFRVDSTPTIIVNNKYRTGTSMAGGYDELIQLVNWLVAKEKK